MADQEQAKAAPRDPALAVDGEIWLRRGQAWLGGRARIALLSAIGQSGSITRAAKAVGISYKTAWESVDAMNHLAGEDLIVRASGGRGGGGTALTERGERLIAAFAQLEAEHEAFLRRIEARFHTTIAGADEDWKLIRRLSMKASARNQFAGRIVTITQGALDEAIEIELPDGLRLVATITQSSRERLELAPGSEVHALIKAPSVTLALGTARLSAENVWPGTVARIVMGPVNAEVVVECAPATRVAASVPASSVARLGLASGQAVSAVFSASSVILAVED